MELDHFPFAASRGDLELVRKLIEAGGDVNAVDSNGATGLHLAIGSNKSSNIISQIVDLLLQAGASLDARNHEGFTPLHTASANCHIESVAQLIRAGAEVNAEVDSNRVTSLFLAIKSDQPDNGCSEVIRLLVEAGASLDHQDTYGFSPLRKAVALGKVNAVRQLILSGANVNERNNAGKSILMVAARSRRNEEDAFQITEMLLNAGALPNVADSQGITPLHAAATLGNARRVVQLIKAGADVNSIDRSRNRTILHSVILSKSQSDQSRFEVVRLLVEAGASLITCNDDHHDALHVAVLWERVQIVDQLILAGANVNSSAGESGETCLHLVATLKGKDDDSLAIMRSLLDAGAAIEARDRNQLTPLHIAVKMGKSRVIERLIEAGANVHAEHPSGQTLLSFAISSCISNCGEVVRLLLRVGAPLERANDTENPLLHQAIARGYIGVVKQLISAGADVHCVDQGGNTCLKVAVLNAEKYDTNRSQIIRILSDAGAPLNGHDGERSTPLQTAVIRGLVDWVESLTEAGVDANAASCSGQISLLYAIRLANVDIRTKIISSLVKAGASVVKSNGRGETPLDIAVDGGRLTATELRLLAQAYVREFPNSEMANDPESISSTEDSNDDLLRVVTWLLKADYLRRKEYTTLHYATMIDDVALMKRIIDIGVDVDAANYRGMTSLHLASQPTSKIKNRHEMVQLLLIAHASINVIDVDGKSALIYALASNDAELVKLLLTAGADPGIVTPDGLSSLHWAISHNHDRSPNLVPMLIEAGAPLNIQEEREMETPLHYAVCSGSIGAIQQLIEAGADVNKVNRYGLTCLNSIFRRLEGQQRARRSSETYRNYYEIVKILLEAGANLNTPDTMGETPLNHAAALGDPKFVEQLIDAGADIHATNRMGLTALAAKCQRTYPPDEMDDHCRVISLLVAAGAKAIHPSDENSSCNPLRRGRPGSCYVYYMECQKELQLMLRTVVGGSTTFYHILRRMQIYRFARNKGLVESLSRREDFTELFPIFSEDLKKSILAASARQNRMDEASNGLRRLITFRNDSICDQILDYLDDEDLLNLRLV